MAFRLPFLCLDCIFVNRQCLLRISCGLVQWMSGPLYPVPPLDLQELWLFFWSLDSLLIHTGSLLYPPLFVPPHTLQLSLCEFWESVFFFNFHILLLRLENFHDSYLTVIQIKHPFFSLMVPKWLKESLVYGKHLLMLKHCSYSAGLAKSLFKSKTCYLG